MYPLRPRLGTSRLQRVALILLLVGVSVTSNGSANADSGSTIVDKANANLAAAGLGVRVGSVELFTLGRGRPGTRDLQNPYRPVPYDSRRNADGARITYLVRQNLGATSNGLTNAQTEPAIDAAVATWASDSCLANAPIVKRSDPGIDTDIFDELVGVGDTAAPDFGNLYRANEIEAGFRPRALFDVFYPGAGDEILGITISFYYLTDINQDGYLDVAWSETYYNDRFVWSTGGELPTIDIQTVALHENGHALGLGHFGPPPIAVMNNSYSGVFLTPRESDHAGMCAVWGAWPTR